MSKAFSNVMAERFRGYLPVIVDVETGGFNHETDALLEIAAVGVVMDSQSGLISPGEMIHHHVEAFEGSNIEPKSLEITGIDPTHPFRGAVSEREALADIFKQVRKWVKDAGCQKAILVGHNAVFDLNFVNSAVKRSGVKRNPFHPFSTFDTVSLAGLAYGQTVLARAVQEAGLEWDNSDAHSALYDTQKTAELFCTIVNQWKQLTPADTNT